MNRSTLLLVCSLVIGIGLTGCHSTVSPDPEGAVYPDPDWAVETPEAHNLDSALLQEAADYAEEHDSNGLVITRHGVIVGEWYWNGGDKMSEQNIFSATKSITSALVGIAQDRGELDIEEKASKYIRQWIGTDSEDVTIRNLISNDSGREWDLVTDYFRMYALAFDKTATAYPVDSAWYNILYVVGPYCPVKPSSVWNAAIGVLRLLNRKTYSFK